jgi:uncharacterized RDD family membrane protein YckC
MSVIISFVFFWFARVGTGVSTTILLHYYLQSTVEVPMETEPIELNLAKWSDRFIAWLIDFIIVTVAIEIIFYAATFPLWFDSNPTRWFTNGATSVGYITRSLIFLAYWTYFESTSGQSIGKKLVQIKTVGISGEALSILDALIESFGKSFLLPLDVLLGWIFTNDRRQRISNRASNSIIIKLKSRVEHLKSNNQVHYTKD